MSFLSFTNKILTVLLLAGATLMLLFIVFSGAVKNYPFNHFYWVQADTSAISSADGDISRWTFWGICHPESYDQGATDNCPHLGADVPISPYDNFGNSSAIPSDFINNRDNYYYLSRFSFPFILIALVFSGVSFICSIMAPCWLAMKQVVTFFIGLALIFCVTGASCITAVSVMTRNQFHDSGYEAKIGASSLGMVWASTACLLILFFLSCCSTAHKMYKKQQNVDQSEYEKYQPNHDSLPMPATLPQTEETVHAPQHESAGIRFFKIRRNQDKVEEDSLV